MPLRSQAASVRAISRSATLRCHNGRRERVLIGLTLTCGAKDCLNLDLFWLKDKSLEDSDDPRDPDVIAQEIGRGQRLHANSHRPSGRLLLHARSRNLDRVGSQHG